MIQTCIMIMITLFMHEEFSATPKSHNREESLQYYKELKHTAHIFFKKQVIYYIFVE